jgi:hypothetical protein
MGDMLWLDGKGDFLDIMTENQISADRDILRITKFSKFLELMQI